MSKSKAYYNLSPNEIEAKLLTDRLWSSANKIRGYVDGREYKFYFLTIFFFKYISDYWKANVFSNIGLHNQKETSAKNWIKPRFIIPENDAFDDIRNYSDSNNLGERLNKAFHEIEGANLDKFEGIFSNLDFNDSKILGEERSKNILLRELIISLEEIDLRSYTIYNEIIARAFEMLLERFLQQSGKMGEEYQTPFQISELLAKLLEPQNNESIYDPACGSGSILIRLCQSREEKMAGAHLYGQEINSNICSIAKMNMIIHELDDAHVTGGDSINYPKFINKKSKTLQKFDVVASNPPFSVGNWWKSGPEYNRFKWGMPPQSKSDYAFIQHMLASSTDTAGRVGIIVNHGVLFRAGIESKIRKKIIEDDLLEAVIGLPNNLFSYTSLPVAVLLFRNGRSKDSNILFIDAAREFIQDKRKNILTLEGIERIVSTYKAFKEDPSDKNLSILGFSHICSKSELAANEYNLNLSRYIHYQNEEEKIDIEELKLEVEKLDEELNKVRNAIRHNLSELGL